MSTGTKIVQTALQYIGAHSPLKPANPEALEKGKDALNSMYARWYDDNIRFGAVPLNAIGDEFSEPMGLYNTIVFNLAIECQPLFPGTQISLELSGLASRTYNDMRDKYQAITIPKPQVRSTLPKGQGNSRSYSRSDNFFDKGDELG